MFSKLTSITSARCANSSTECGEKKPGGSEIAEAKRDVMQSCIRELSLTRDRLNHVKSSDFLTRENST